MKNADILDMVYRGKPCTALLEDRGEHTAMGGC